MKTQILTFFAAHRQVLKVGFAILAACGLFLVGCTKERQEDITLPAAPDQVTDRSTDEHTVVGFYANGEYTLNFTFDQAQTILDFMLEQDNTSGELLEVYISDLPEQEDAEPFLIFASETEDDTFRTYGLLIERSADPEGELIYTLNPNPPSGERNFICEGSRSCTRCAVKRATWQQGWAPYCTCAGGSGGCEMTTAGWWYFFLFDPMAIWVAE